MDGLRARLFDLLGLSPERPEPARAVVVSEKSVAGGKVIELQIDGRPATFLTPGGNPPALLYCHAHGGQYELGRRELMHGASWLSAPWGEELLAAGFAALCVDMPGFGDRICEGRESALAKAGLWRGRPLFGQMIGDLQLALGWLVESEMVDVGRIAAMGVSMGAAHAFWLAALDDRVGAVLQFCVLSDVATMIDSGAHDLHGLYLVVPGLLECADMGDVAARVAPRPQLIAYGEQDNLTPQCARDRALARVRRAYGRSAALRVVADPEVGHHETPPMRRAAFSFLSDWVNGAFAGPELRGIPS